MRRAVSDLSPDRVSLRNGTGSAQDIVGGCLKRLEERNPPINAFNFVTDKRARAQARALDAMRAADRDLPELAGLVFAAKNLFDIQGYKTLAGSIINQDLPAADRDAEAVDRLTKAGAILVGATNMDEYAYGFTTENTHFGATRNPHDPSRVAGGSSGGSAAAVAAGIVPVALGTDTNGSIRVPAAFCGIYGFKPTFGRISLDGVFPFVQALDHAGPFAHDSRDLLAVSSVLLDPADDEVSLDAPGTLLPDSSATDGGLRIGVLGGYFQHYLEPNLRNLVDKFTSAFPRATAVELPGAADIRSAAFLLTASEGGKLHHANLRARYTDFDPNSRDRLAAGLLMPEEWVEQAKRILAWGYAQAAPLFEKFDILIAPATPCVAPLLGQDTITLGGQDMPARGSLGLHTQPLTPLGVPIVSAPLAGAEPLPVGVQIIGGRGQDEKVLAFTCHLERHGLLAAFEGKGLR